MYVIPCSGRSKPSPIDLVYDFKAHFSLSVWKKRYNYLAIYVLLLLLSLLLLLLLLSSSLLLLFCMTFIAYFPA